MNCKHYRRCQIALAFLLHGGALAAAAPRGPDFAFPAGSEWDWNAQQDFFRSKFGGPEESARSPSWPQNQYDPHPAEGEARAQELILPMPCGGAMVFRRIAVGGNRGWLGEQQIALGGGGEGQTTPVGPRLAYISGSFSGDDSGQGAGRHFYLGKYEVTELQYKVLTQPCPETPNGRRPAVKVSWYDAVDFTRRYTEWLFKNAAERLPREDGVPGFLRLPTEVEWEYAARGGLAVSHEEFQEAVFRMEQGSIDDHAWFRESVASSFEPHPVGSLLPNPLGLHDILGNASELIFELFHLSARGRMHAQPGGFLVKGAHFRSRREAVGTSWRQEHPHFSPVTGLANRLDTVGFRIAVSAPVLTSEQRLQAIRQERARLASDAAPPAALDSCRDLAAGVHFSLSAMQASLDRCLAESGRPSSSGRTR